MSAAPSPLPVVILISGRGSNLQSIIDAIAQQRLDVEIRAVISNRPAAKGLQRAREAGIAVAVVDHAQFPDEVRLHRSHVACLRETRNPKPYTAPHTRHMAHQRP